MPQDSCVREARMIGQSYTHPGNSINARGVVLPNFTRDRPLDRPQHCRRQPDGRDAVKGTSRSPYSRYLTNRKPHGFVFFPSLTELSAS